ncbi:MAG TPA: T9SS type A sorting domain-containing protein [Candidatus Cloacimonetes bacterium]|nr:T9SS type A sorting domain-containing protein [Candidatus Cloacimonadota bacterium]HEX37335.1 T9SS type A sorting domain-containing protein [Candidatus Cloacimonadota bacterium]
MKKILCTLAVFILANTALFAGKHFTFNTKGDGIDIHFTDSRATEILEEKVISTTITLPSMDVEIIINDCTIAEYSTDGELLSTYKGSAGQRIAVANSFAFRELIGHTITIKNVIYDKEKDIYSEIVSADISVIPRGQFNYPGSISRVYKPVYRSLVENFDSSYLAGLPTEPSKMLIICHQILANYIQDFINWKEAKGIECQVATLDETGTTSNEVKAYIQQVYDTSDVPPDYVLLIGDVDDYFAVPSFYFSAENDVSDHPYSMLAGSDYFPEVIVGRISIDEVNQLWTIINKVVSYEKTPYVTEPEWLKKALVVAGNYSTTPPTPSTPVKVSRWLRDKMLNYGFSQVDTVFYPPIYPGTSEIISRINAGISFLNYRGWGDANGWHYPEFHVSDMTSLSNGLLTPVVTSFVCNTGDFANTSADPCFGEAITQLGTPTAPQGGVVFIGPSDLHTSTKLNNSIFSGFYYGLLDEGIYDFGSAVLRGKVELYHNFPLQQAPGEQVEFYFHVYNILGDPSLTMWTTIPEEIDCTLPGSLSIGTNYLDIACPNLDDAVVTAIKDGEFYSVEMIENGQTTLAISPQSEGTMTITITSPNYIPFIQDIDVIQETVDVGVLSYDADPALVAGSTSDINITLKNYGTGSAGGVQATLSSNSDYVNIGTPTQSFGDIAAGETADGSYDVTMDVETPDNEVIEFTLAISPDNIAKISMLTSSLVFEVDAVNVVTDNGWLISGQTNEIHVTIKNIGSLDGNNIQGTLSVYSDAATMISNQASFGTITAGTTGQGTFDVEISANCFIGRNIPFELVLTDEEGRIDHVYFSLEVGPVDTSAPTGPDAYGYYAYDSYDVDYDEVPTYEWIEIDPNEGGLGEVILMVDDDSETIDLPFDFTFYGEIFNEITICSNGWISFITNNWTNFRNWDIPSALGPYGQVCAYWDDLIGETFTINDTIYHHDMRICHYYDAAQNRFIIEWNGCVNRFDDTSVEKFELILFDPAYTPANDGNGEIQINYKTINNPDATSNYSTVGIENLDQSDGVLYTYANVYPASATELENELAIKFTTDPPDPYYDFDESEIETVTLQIYPQPTEGITQISYKRKEISPDQITASIYNIKGQKIIELTPETSEDKVIILTWDGRNEAQNAVPNGIYFIKIRDNKTQIIDKIILLK